jgi:hypothetical protein
MDIVETAREVYQTYGITLTDIYFAHRTPMVKIRRKSYLTLVLPAIFTERDFNNWYSFNPDILRLREFLNRDERNS